MKPVNKKLNEFCEMNKFKHLILKPTCFKGLFPSSIDLILTNFKQSFMKSNMCETGISDHYRMIFSVLRRNKISCYKKYDQISFNKHLKTRFHNWTCHLKYFLRYFNQH